MEGYLTSLEDELMDFRDVEYKNFTKKEEEIIESFFILKVPGYPSVITYGGSLQRISLMR